MERERVIYFDLIKSIAIFLVCLYHAHALNLDYLVTPTADVYFKNFLISLASMGVPLFFLVNGSLMLNTKFDLKKHIGKILKILLQTILWIFITLVLTAIIYKIEYSDIWMLLREIWYWPSGTLNHFWFIFSVLQIYIFYPLIKNAFNEKRILYFVLVTMFILTFGNNFIDVIRHTLEYLLGEKLVGSISFNYFSQLNFAYNTYLYSIVYFIIGGLLTLKLKRVNYIKKRYLVGVCMISNLLLVGYTVLVSRIYGYRYDPVWNGYSTIFVFCMTITFYIICSKIEIKNILIEKIIILIGRNTLGIYFIHMIYIFMFKRAFIAKGIANSIIYNTIFAIFILGLSLSTTILIKKIPKIKKIL